MKYLKTYKMYEIANTIIKTDIIYESFAFNRSTFRFILNDITYEVWIRLHGDKNKSAIQIDFHTYDKNEISTDMTNKGNSLEVLSNVVGIIKYYFSLDGTQSFSGEPVNFKDITIGSIIIDSKQETEGDDRRQKIYEYYIKSNISKMNINILETIDISEHFDSKSFVTKYRITPIKIKDIL